MNDDIKTPPQDDGSPAPQADDMPPHPTYDEAVEVPDHDTKSRNEKPRKKRGFHFPGYRRWKQLSTKQQIISLLICGILLIGAVYGAMQILDKEAPAPLSPNIQVEKPKPTTKQSRLTGVEVPIEQDDLPVTGVMIENSPDARPQSGLFDAGVVFEAIAEGGITRFLALYQTEMPESIGPVRSVRPYYLDWLVGFDAPIAHAGGSGQALAEIRSQGIKDLEAFQNPGAYQRVSGRYAPHNLYTSRAKLLDLQRSKGWNTSNFNGFARKKKEEKPTAAPTAKTINLSISSFNYNVSFAHDAASNTYPRTLAGRPHMDEKAGKQIAPKVVIALVTEHSYAGVYSVYRTIGTGPVYVFQDGQVIEGTWHKADRKGELSFTTADGKPLELNPGQTWITAVKAGAVQYAP